MIQDFEISIAANADEQYLIRTEKVAKGVPHAEEIVRWPVTRWLAKAQAFMHDPLTGLLQGQQRLQEQRYARTKRPNGYDKAPPSDAYASAHLRTVPTETETLVHLGQSLHDSLFQGQLRESWIAAQSIAQNRQTLLRLRIGMKDSRLQQLPWEALHAGARPLATGTDVIFSRYILDRRQGHFAQITERKEFDRALRILVVIASPNDQERLELKQEVEQLRAELHPSSEEDEGALDIRLTLLEQPGRAELTQELDRGNYQVLHYAGHSDLGNAGGDLSLVSRQTGLTERLSGEDLAGLLVNNGVQLAVFNSCRGGYSSSGAQGWQERNLAQALINRGMPSVIAMAERIPDTVAIDFTKLLYRNLRQGRAIDLSLNRTRQGLISAHGSHQFYWALPTLYMQPSFNGYLIDIDGDHEQAERLDAISDSFSDLLIAPNLEDAERLSVSQKAQPAGQMASVNRSSYSNERDRLAAYSTSNAQSNAPPQTQNVDHGDIGNNSDIGNRQTENQPKLVSNHDARSADTMVQRLGAPPIAADIDAEIEGELRVPEDIKTPRGFYGEPVVTPKPVSRSAEVARDRANGTKANSTKANVASMIAPRSQQANLPTSSHSDSLYNKGTGRTLKASGASQTDVTRTESEKTNASDFDTDGSIVATIDSEELIGERLTRSHTLHTKILTLPGIASIAIILIAGAMTVGLIQRVRSPRPASSEIRSELAQSNRSLPFQVELALDQGNIDAAIAPAQELIKNGKFAAVIAAFDTESVRQQQDVIVSFFKGRAQWGLVKQGSADFTADDAMRSWMTALESEPDWMEIAMALGFAHYAIGREQQALESWEQAIELAKQQSDEQAIYFSDQSKEDYILNAHAGLAMAALGLSKIEVDPEQRNQLLDQALDAYQTVMNAAPADFSSKALGSNWLWLSPAIADWADTKRELSELL